MTDRTIDCINRMISMLNNIDRVVEDEYMEIADKLQLTYTSAMLIKSSVQDLIAELDGCSDESRIGFKADKEDK